MKILIILLVIWLAIVSWWILKFNVHEKLCKEDGYNIRIDLEPTSLGNWHLKDGTPTYMTFWTKCK